MSNCQRRLGDVSRVNPESLGVGTPADFAFKYVDISCVNQGRIDWSAVQEQRFATAPSRARRVVQAGDVLICTVRPALQAHGYINTAHGQPIVASTGFAVVRCDRELRSRYLFHSLFGPSISQQLRERESGTNYPAVSERDIKELLLYCPEACIQDEIAQVLDAADEAIAKTEALIAKLKSIKQGLLHDLLTRGLDHNGELRDPEKRPGLFKQSVLGLIPAAWNVFPLSSVATLQRGFDLPLQRRRPGSVPIYGSNGVDGWHNESRVTGPGVITGRSGSIGFVYYSEFDFWPLNTTLYVKDFHGNEPRFVRLLLESLRLERFGASTGVPSLNRNFVHPTRVAVPPFEEQVAIVSLERGLQTRIDAESEYLAKLRAIKKGLMQDLLTGRVRVPAGKVLAPATG